MIDIQLLIAQMREQGILKEIQKKRLTTSELPATLYVKLVVASVATKKGLSATLATALETYCIRNEEKHLNEIKLQSASVGMALEEYLVSIIAERLK